MKKQMQTLKYEILEYSSSKSEPELKDNTQEYMGNLKNPLLSLKLKISRSESLPVITPCQDKGYKTLLGSFPVLNDGKRGISINLDEFPCFVVVVTIDVMMRVWIWSFVAALGENQVSP
ncbi:hypothetical protein Gotur_008333 [Gossypium turneri]